MQRIVELANVSQGLARSGRAAGARAGDWNVRIAESGDVRDGWLKLDRLKEIGVLHNTRTERHLLRPFDVLVTARAGSVQSALVPPAVSRTVASVTLLVVRPKEPESGMGALPLVFSHVGIWPVADREADDYERDVDGAVGQEPGRSRDTRAVPNESST